MRYPLFIILATLFTATVEGQTLSDTLHSDPDTLATIVVTGDGRLPIYHTKPKEITPGKKTLGDILGEVTLDKIMHPLAFNERKKEKHRKKMMRVLKEYDLIEGDPNGSLKEFMKKEGIILNKE